MAKNILVLQGSARKNKNTATLAQSFSEGATEAGNKVTFVDVVDYQINGCRDCKYCFAHEGECVQKDGMQDIYSLLRSHDMVVLATPIYFFGMTAQIKVLLDRMYAGIGKPFPIESMALLVTFQDSNQEIVKPIIDQFTNMTDYCHYDNKGTIYAHGLNNDDADIKVHPALKEAYELGKSIS